MRCFSGIFIDIKHFKDLPGQLVCCYNKFFSVPEFDSQHRSIWNFSPVISSTTVPIKLKLSNTFTVSCKIIICKDCGGKVGIGRSQKEESYHQYEIPTNYLIKTQSYTLKAIVTKLSRMQTSKLYKLRYIIHFPNKK